MIRIFSFILFLAIGPFFASCSEAQGASIESQIEQVDSPIGKQCFAVMNPQSVPLGALTPAPKGTLKSLGEGWVVIESGEGEIWVSRPQITMLVFPEDDSSG